MKAWLFVTLATFAGLCCAQTGQERAVQAGADLIGHPAPALSIRTIDGERIDLDAWYGKKPVYLKFWATWCVPCREQMPHFERTFENAGKDMLVLAIDTGFNESRDDVIAYRRQLGLKMPIAIDDGRFAAAFHLRVTPQHVVIGRDGRIAYVGHLADEHLEQALQAARRSPSKAVASAGSPLEPRYRIGDRVADLKLVAIDGQSVPALDSVRHRPLAIVFLSPWCESYFAESQPQRAAACGAMRTQIQTLAGERGARWVGIASGLWATREDVVQYVNSNKIGYPVVLDESGALFRAFSVTSVPVVVLLNDDAWIRRRIEAPSADLRAALAASSR
jgi:thiol-disulfide isomerase/thioredoxin